ncbi:WYL domain-containing protein [Lacihabitans sp. LS3-19]|uniref:helix-turn-helix transcriptional regulator n=1 Tax=Lacihabitans sp. LS3-19 TaxID=2487335 RepID=UPI0020CFC383|nr:WYL domain-containing protein [Lacihabitans sp. LS3-19]MCP9767917.1 WYL domain-containing protein [Lacihabitans sp. LS3-19]
MATNKHATIRYHALDQCFSNFGRKYFMDDLISACNRAIYDHAGIEDGVKRRQIFDDITFMESEAGWAIPLQRHKDGKKVYYRYESKEYSIKSQAINETEARQLQETIMTLSRFKGMPQFEWMEELLIRLESSFNIKNTKSAIVGFEQNLYLKGLEHFSRIFEAIQNQKVLSIVYKSFKNPEAHKQEIHPYFLKQYNNRWFLFGLSEKYESVSNLALDRIQEVEESNSKYLPNKTFNFEEHFDDVVGVTVTDEEPQKVLLEIEDSLWPYIESKPIHGSQKYKGKTEKGVQIELNLQINYELVALIFGLGEKVKVVEPEHLANEILAKANNLILKY